MLSQKDLLKNIDELYRAYLRNEPERLRLKKLNSALRAENSRLKTENDRLKTPASGITPLSPLTREILFLNAQNVGGIVNNFWQGFIHDFRLGAKAGKSCTYDLYTGYLFEYNGFNVEYCGIANGVRDDGMNLICRKGSRAVLVRCKEEILTPNFVYYLAARALRFKMDNPHLEVSALCVTSQTLTDDSQIIAEKFSIDVKDNMPFQNFPYVKCKVLTDKKVCYTPKNDEYITVQINPDNGDMFCLNVNDAIAKGFTPN